MAAACQKVIVRKAKKDGYFKSGILYLSSKLNSKIVSKWIHEPRARKLNSHVKSFVLMEHFIKGM